MFTHAVVDHSNKVNKELFANEAKNGTISNSMTPRQPATGLRSCQFQTLHSAKDTLKLFRQYQGGRSCAGARVAPAEKFGLGQKF